MAQCQQDNNEKKKKEKKVKVITAKFPPKDYNELEERRQYSVQG